MRQNDAAAQGLLTEAQKGKRDKADYDKAMETAREALSKLDYDQAVTQANTALKARPNDAAAQRLLTEAQNGKRDKTAYDTAMAAAREALSKRKVEGGVGQASRARRARSH